MLRLKHPISLRLWHLCCWKGLVCLVCSGVLTLSCKNRSPRDEDPPSRLEPPYDYAEPPETDDALGINSGNITRFFAKVLNDSTAMDYTGTSCKLAKGTTFAFKTYMDENIDTVEFSIEEPVEGCNFGRYFFVMAKDIEILAHKPSFHQSSHFPYIDNSKNYEKQSYKRYHFPLASRPIASYTSGGREFGAQRILGGRKHAAVDLLSHSSTPVVAVADGKILDAYPFYQGTYAVVVDHYSFIVRYGEVNPIRAARIRGKIIKSGQTFASTGTLYSGASMLHFEQYRGSHTGPLTIYNFPYHRRGDLLNPTSFIQSLEKAGP